MQTEEINSKSIRTIEVIKKKLFQPIQIRCDVEQSNRYDAVEPLRKSDKFKENSSNTNVFKLMHAVTYVTGRICSIDKKTSNTGPQIGSNSDRKRRNRNDEFLFKLWEIFHAVRA